MPNTAVAEDFWPESIRADAKSPVAILRTQAVILRNRTRGLLTCDVKTRHTGDSLEPQTTHSLELAAPALRYSRGLLDVSHAADEVYPAWFESALLPVRDEYDEDLLGQPWQANDEGEFNNILRQALNSPRLVALINSLLAKINDTTGEP